MMRCSFRRVRQLGSRFTTGHGCRNEGETVPDGRALRLCALVVLLLLLTGCVSPDCEWNGVVKTWIDANGNGQWDEDEAPLAGVNCFAEGSYSVGVGEAVSNQHGEARLSTMLAGCPEEGILTVWVEPPPGYRLVTQGRLPVRLYDTEPLLFGFLPVGE